MFRRISAWLLVLVILVSLIPMGAAAADEDKVVITDYPFYQRGDKYPFETRVWIQGANVTPSDEDVEDSTKYKWDHAKDKNGWITAEGCGKEAHKHKVENGCYDGDILICVKQAHTHSLVCTMKDAYYLWEVTEKPEGSGGTENPEDPENPEPTEPTETTEPTEAPAAPEDYVFRVRNITADQGGMPMEGAEFVLLAPPDEEGGNWLVQNNAEKDIPFITSEGYAYFMGPGKDTRVGEAVWHLAQNASAFVEGGAYYNQYKSSDDQWDLTVMVYDDGTYELLDVQECHCCTCTEDCDAPGHKCNPDCKCKERTVHTADNGETEGYDSETRTITFINDAVLVDLYIDVETENMPAGMTELKVNIYGPGDDDEEEVTITGAGEYWQFEKRGLKPGIYTIEAQVEDCEPIYRVIRSGLGEEEQISNAVELGFGNSSAFFTIAFPEVENPTEETTEPTEETTEPSEPEEEYISNTIVINTASSDGEPLSGARYGLFDGNTLVDGRVFSQTVEGLEQYMIPGEVVTFNLRQQAAPAGYQISEDNDRYQVRIYENDEGETEVRLKDTKLFTNAIEIGEDGQQIIVFRNVKAPEPEEPEEGGLTTIQLTCNVTVEVDAECAEPTEAIQKMLNRKHSFIVEWEDGQSEPLSLKDGETGTFEVPISQKTPYTVKPQEKATDYSLVMTLGGKTISSNQKLSGDTHLTAAANYTIIPGDEVVNLFMTKVNARTKETLADAKFTLKNPKGQVAMKYETDEDGSVEIIDLLDEPGKYTLIETAAPKEYQKMNTPIKINVAMDYIRTTKGGKPVLKQGLVATISHKYVEKQADGSYLIVNYHESDIPQTGDEFRMDLWIGVMAISAVALTAVALDLKKKKASR